MKRMLINATQPEELRVALVDGQTLYDLDIETPHQKKKKANIYKGVITRVEPSLEAAFVDYGSDRHGFLPFKELAEEYFPKNQQGELNIQQVLKEGQEIIIQVQKEERGNKGAALTTQITLAGPYVVMMPNNPKSGGISRRIEGEDRSNLRDTLKEIDIPHGMGLIVRTAGVGKSPEELQWGINYLAQLWEAIKQAANSKPAPFLIHQESDIVTLAIRDYLRQDIGEILIDDMETFQRARDFIQQVMPQHTQKVKSYQDNIPLFTRFQIETQIESAYQREVVLPSGGVIVIDMTEALTSIDINSSRSTKGGDIEETAFHTNMEAASEIARQLRLRDLGGLIVIDFIDMHSSRHQREIENQMRDAAKNDRARVQIGKISRFGLLEMSRQRLRPSIEESNHIVCPRCKGVGVIRGIESLALSILRLLEEESMKEGTRRITVQLPVDVATFLLNEKRAQIIKLEDRYELHVLIVPNEHLETPQYLMERTRSGDDTVISSSYETKSVIAQETAASETTTAVKEEPAIKNIQPSAPPPAVKSGEPGLLSRLWAWLFTSSDKTTKRKTTHPQSKGGRNQNNARKNTNTRRRGNGNGRRRTPNDQTSNETQDQSRDQSRTQQGRDQRSQQNEPRGERRGGRTRSDNRRQSTPSDHKTDRSQDASQATTTQQPAKASQDTGSRQERKPQSQHSQQQPRPRPTQTNVESQSTAEKDRAPAEATEQKREPRKRRSRYNSRSSLNRRRAPRDAGSLTVENITNSDNDKPQEKPASQESQQ